MGIAASCTIRKNRALPRISSPWVMVSWQGTSPATAHICRVRVTVARSFARVPVWEKLLPSGLVPSMVTIAPSGRFGAPEGAVRRKISVRLWLSFCATGMRRGGVLGDRDNGRVRVSMDSGSFLFGGEALRINRVAGGFTVLLAFSFRDNLRWPCFFVLRFYGHFLFGRPSGGTIFLCLKKDSGERQTKGAAAPIGSPGNVLGHSDVLCANHFATMRVTRLSRAWRAPHCFHALCVLRCHGR